MWDDAVEVTDEPVETVLIRVSLLKQQLCTAN